MNNQYNPNIFHCLTGECRWGHFDFTVSPPIGERVANGRLQPFAGRVRLARLPLSYHLPSMEGVALAHSDGFDFLARQPDREEVNFWSPSDYYTFHGTPRHRRLRPRGSLTKFRSVA